jgi:hypothetical protein
MTKLGLPNLTAAQRGRNALWAIGLFGVALSTSTAVCAQPIAQSSTSVTARATAPTPDPRTPFLELARAVRVGDLTLAVQTAIPPSQVQQMRLAYELKRQAPVTDAERAEFAKGVGKLTAASAVDDMMAEIEPKLAEARPKAAAALLMGLGALQVALASEDTKLSTDQRVALQRAYPNIQRWASSTDFLSSDTMRRALTLLSNAARNTGVRTADDVKQLSMDQALNKASIMFTAGKQALQLYGLDVNAITDSLQVEVLSRQSQTALVRTTVSVFGAPISSEHELILREGRWYSKGTLSFDVQKQVSR